MLVGKKTCLLEYLTYLAANELASGGGLDFCCASSVADEITMSPQGLAGLVEEMWPTNSSARDPNPVRTRPPLGRTLQSHRRSPRAGRQKCADCKHKILLEFIIPEMTFGSIALLL